MSERWRRAGPTLAVILFAVLFFAPQIFAGRSTVTANPALWRPWVAAASQDERSAPSFNPDTATSYLPRRETLRQAAHVGELPLWNPYTFCGASFIADPQAQVFYPPSWLLAPLEAGRQMGLFAFLHAAWGGIGIVVLLRRWRVGREICGAAGVAFVVNGYFAKHFGMPAFLGSAAWAPWVIVATVDLFARPDRVRAARLALAGALLFLAGQPQTALQTATAALIVAAVAVAAGVGMGSERWKASRQSLRSALAWLGLAAVGAALLAAVQLFPTWEMAGRSARAVLPYETVLSGAFHPADALRFVVPEFFGTPLTRDAWSAFFVRGDGFYLRGQANSIFAGTPLFLLALWGMIGPRTRRQALPFTVLFVLALLVAFGSPLARLAWQFLPGFRFSRIDRLGYFLVLAQIVPAALATQHLSRVSGGGRRVFGALVLLAAGMAPFLVRSAGVDLPTYLGATASLDAGSFSATLARTQWTALFAAATGVAFLLPAARWSAALPWVFAVVQLFLFAGPYRGDRPSAELLPATPGIERLREVLEEGSATDGGGRMVRFGRDFPVRPYALSSVLPPSTNVVHRLRDTMGYNALTDRRLGDALESAWQESVFSHGIWSGRRIVAPERPSSLEHPLVDALAVRAVVGAELPAATGWRHDAAGGEFALAINEEALARFRMVGKGRGISAAAMEQLLASGDFDPACEAFWIGEGRVGAAGGISAVVPADDRIELLEDARNRIELRTHSNEERVLVIADAWDPGWRATVDGAAVDILPVFGILRGLTLSAGSHTVAMIFAPASFRWGAVLSLLGLLTVGAAIAWPGKQESAGTGVSIPESRPS